MSTPNCGLEALNRAVANEQGAEPERFVLFVTKFRGQILIVDLKSDCFRVKLNPSDGYFLFTMNEDDLALFLDSFERCIKNERFIPAFYEIFLGSSEEIRSLFDHTDFSKQRRVLKISLYEMVAASARRSVDLTELSKLTERHRQLKIQPQYYDIWMQSLVLAVEECDYLFNSEIGRVWQEAFRAGIGYMKSEGVDRESQYSTQAKS